MAPNISGVVGTVFSQEDIYLESAPNFWFGGVLLNNPDSNGYYWGLSGTGANPVFKIGCFTDFSFKDEVEQNPIICDAIGQVALRETRSFVEATFTLKTFLPLSTIQYILRGGAVTVDSTNNVEQMGIGQLTDRDTYRRAYFSRVYDPVQGDFFSVTMHRAQFVGAFEIATPFADSWNMAVTMRGFADSTKPYDQTFATIVRYDPSAL